MKMVRLTLDDIRDMVLEAVDEVGSQLYQNAAKAAYEKGKYYDDHDSRVMKFRRAAVNRHREDNTSSIYNQNKYNDGEQEQYISDNNGNKLFIFDSDYKSLKDLYNGVKQGRLLIHCREVDVDNIPRTLFPEFGETVQDAYGCEIPDGCDAPELIFASDRFNWARNYPGNHSAYSDRRNGVFFVYGDNFEMSIGDGYVQTIDGDIYRRDDIPITVETDDWFSDEPADVAAVMVV